MCHTLSNAHPGVIQAIRLSLIFTLNDVFCCYKVVLGGYHMGEKITFDVNINKTIETIVWLAKQKPGIDIYHVAKVLYFADKKHLNRYARPISGDTYIKMKDGPAPSLALDIINTNCLRFSQDVLDVIATSIETTGRYKNNYALRDPDMRYFSESDLECLQESFNENGHKSFDELRNATHDEPCYVQSEKNCSVDYLLMVDDDNPLGDDIKDHISSLSAYIGT